MIGTDTEGCGQYHGQRHYLPQGPGVIEKPAPGDESDDDAERSPPQEPDGGSGGTLTIVSDS